MLVCRVGTAKIVVTETTGKSRKRARTPDSVPSTRAVDRVKGSARSKCKAVHEDRAEDEFENIAIALAPSSLGTVRTTPFASHSRECIWFELGMLGCS